MIGSRVLQYVLLDGRGEPQLIDGRQRIHYGQVGSHITDYTLGESSSSLSLLLFVFLCLVAKTFG